MTKMATLAVVGLALSACARAGQALKPATQETSEPASPDVTTTTSGASTADIPQTAAGCVGYVDGLWYSAPTANFANLVAEEVADCWASPPAQFLSESDAFTAYCVGYGAGAIRGGSTPQEGADLFEFCLNDGKDRETTRLFLPHLQDSATLLDTEGLTAWLAIYGPAE